MAPLSDLANKYGVAIVAVHHARKAPGEDALDEVSGTTGLTGAADAVAVLRRERGQFDAVLSISGRDVDESELALKGDPILKTWTLLGDATTYQRSKERNAVLQALHDSGPMTPKDLAGLVPSPAAKWPWMSGGQSRTRLAGRGRAATQ